jgi:hypothetical protein
VGARIGGLHGDEPVKGVDRPQLKVPVGLPEDGLEDDPYQPGSHTLVGYPVLEPGHQVADLAAADRAAIQPRHGLQHAAEQGRRECPGHAPQHAEHAKPR